MFPGGSSGEEDDVLPDQVDRYEDAVGRRVAWIYFSQNWYRGLEFPIASATWIRDRGSVPFVRLMPRSDDVQGHAEPRFTLEAITAGEFDDGLERWAEAARAFETPIIAEFGTEVNGEWFPWNGVWYGRADDGPRAFRAAYRHVVELVRSQGASNVTWVFHVNDADVPDESWNRLENYYPGADVVDWLGVSVYGAQIPTDDEWPLFRDSMDDVMPRLVALAGGKPIFVFEFGVTDGNPLGGADRWADAALADLIGGRWPQVRGFSWWNETWQNDDGRDTDMRVYAIPGMSEVFKRRLASERIVDRPLLGPTDEVQDQAAGCSP